MKWCYNNDGRGEKPKIIRVLIVTLANVPVADVEEKKPLYYKSVEYLPVM